MCFRTATKDHTELERCHTPTGNSRWKYEERELDGDGKLRGKCCVLGNGLLRTSGLWVGCWVPWTVAVAGTCSFQMIAVGKNTDHVDLCCCSTNKLTKNTSRFVRQFSLLTSTRCPKVLLHENKRMFRSGRPWNSTFSFELSSGPTLRTKTFGPNLTRAGLGHPSSPGSPQ